MCGKTTTLHTGGALRLVWEKLEKQDFGVDSGNNARPLGINLCEETVLKPRAQSWCLVLDPAHRLALWA